MSKSWLVTYDPQLGRAAVAKKLKALGCQIDPSADPIPVGGEEVIAVEGPADLPQKVRGAGEKELKVHANSTAEPYRW
jgi:hypothetical protein